MEFEFNLDDTDTQNSNELDNFSFEPTSYNNQYGGAGDDDENDYALPGEELMEEDEEPEQPQNENPENLEIELVGDNDDADEAENDDLLNNVESSIIPRGKEDEDMDFTTLINKAQTTAQEQVPDKGLIRMDAELEKGHVVTAPVIIETDDLDENSGKVDMDTVDTYISKLKHNLEEEIDSVEVDDLMEKLNKNMMNSSEYSKYLKSLKKFYQDMKSKKKDNFKFEIEKDGALVKTNIESGEVIKIKAPTYTNIKHQLSNNKLEINKLLFSLDTLRRSMMATNDYRIQDKLSPTYDRDMNKLRELLSENKELMELFGVLENREKIELTNENIAQMKISQVGNYSRVKELINSNGGMGERVEAIMDYLNLNNKIIKSYEKTRNYYDVQPEEYIVSRELPPVFKNKKVDTDDDEEASKPAVNTNAWNPDSPKYAPHSQEYAPHSQEYKPTSPVDKVLVDEEKEKKRKNFYSFFTKGKTIEAKEAAKAENTQGLDVEPLPFDIVGDDIEGLQSKVQRLEEDEEDDDEVLEYKFNNKEKLQNPEELRELEQSRKLDQAIPLDSVSESDGDEDVDTRDTGDMTQQDLNKISRQLNKPADENIKVIELDTNLSFKPKTCDDSKTKRSNIKTTNVALGKKRRQKDIDTELKNCIFPFKTVKGRGKSKEETYHSECLDNGVAPMCATERTDDCKIKTWAYCKPSEE